MSSSLAYRPHIDGLRAVAVLAVVIYHFFPGHLRGGFAGVDIFFVISGYLISRILLNSLAAGRFSFADFYARRIRRIFPALCLVLATGLVLGWVTLLPDEFAQLSRHTLSGAAFVENFRLWGEAGYFDNASERKPLMHLWSLAIEEQYYMLYPVILWGAWRLRWPIGWVLAMLALLSFEANMYTVRVDPTAAFFMPHTRMWELLAGAMLGWWHGSDRRDLAQGWRAELATLAGLLTVTTAILAIRDGHDYPGWKALLPVTGALLLIHAGGSARLGRLLANGPMVFIGKISYPLYLWHWLLLAFCRIVDGAPVRERNIAFVLSFVLAWLTYRLVEQPLRHGGRNAMRTGGLATAMLVLGVVAVWQPPQRGALFATSERIRKLNDLNLVDKVSCRPVTGVDFHDDWCNDGNAPQEAPTVALLGDSFSNVFATTLLEYAAQSKPAGFAFRQMARGQCPSLLDYGVPTCRELVKAEAAYIARTPSIHTVVLASHWPAYANGKDYAILQEDGAKFDAAFRRTVEYYQGLGRKVVVFLSPPTGADPRACFPRPLQNMNNLCHQTAVAAWRNDGNYRTSMLPYLAERKVATLDPFRYLCDAQQCRVIDGEMIMYVDQTHLSGHGSRWLARHASGDLDALLLPH